MFNQPYFLFASVLIFMVGCGTPKSPPTPQSAPVAQNSLTNTDVQSKNAHHEESKPAADAPATVVDCSQLNLEGKWTRAIHHHTDEKAISSTEHYEFEKSADHEYISNNEKTKISLELKLNVKNCVIETTYTAAEDVIPTYSKIISINEEATQFTALNCDRDSTCSKATLQHDWSHSAE